MITPQLINAVRDAVDIVDVAGDMTRLEKKGKRYKGLCPFHKEKTPSFSVDPTQGLYYCFGCGAGGDAIKLFMEQSGDDFPAAIEALARRYGIPLPARRAAARGEPEREVGSALKEAAAYFQSQLARHALPGDYLDRRRIPAELRQLFGLGYAPDGWRNLLRALHGRVRLDDLIAAGLVGRSRKSNEPYDRFRNRLMFPIHTASGRLVGFGGRTLGDDRAKYINTAETESFHKGRLLYGFHQAKRELRDRGEALLVEGYFDVLGVAAGGIAWSVAGMGTALTADQARLLARYVDRVVVAYDGDAAGEKAFQRSLPILLGAGLSVRRARFPADHDPDSWRLEKGDDALREAIDGARDAVWLEVERLLPGAGERDPARQARAAREIIELLKMIRDPVERDVYRRRAAEYLGVPERALATRSGSKDFFRAVDSPAAASREVRTEEEKALFLLLRADAAVPPLADLPPAEIFLDAECRNIYEAFCDLYKEGGHQAPVGAEVMAKLGDETRSVDRLLRLLLEESDAEESEILQTLDKLLRRWRKQRQSELIRRIKQAQHQGDDVLLTQLLKEKATLSRSLHPRMTGKLW